MENGLVIYARARAFKTKATYLRPRPRPNNSKAKAKNLALWTKPKLDIRGSPGSRSVTWDPAAVTYLPLPQPKLVLDLATPDGCKAELTTMQDLLCFHFRSLVVSFSCFD